MEADEAQADWSCNIQSTKPSGNGYFRSAPHHVTPVVVVSVVLKTNDGKGAALPSNARRISRYAGYLCRRV